MAKEKIHSFFNAHWEKKKKEKEIEKLSCEQNVALNVNDNAGYNQTGIALFY